MRYIRFHTRNYPKFIPFVVSSHITAPHWRLTDVMRETHPRVFPTTLRILFFLSLRKKNRWIKDSSSFLETIQEIRDKPTQVSSCVQQLAELRTLCTKFLFAYTEYVPPPLHSLLPPSLPNFISLQLRFVELWSLSLSLSPLPSFLIPMRRESWFTIYDQRKSKNTWKLSLQVSGYIDRFSANVNFNIQKVMVKRINLLLLLLKSKYFRND